MAWTLIEHSLITVPNSQVTLGVMGTIPQTYKTLKLVISSRDSNAQVYGNLRIRFNNSSTSFSGRLLQGNGSTATSTTNATTEVEALSTGANATASTFASTEVTLPNYTTSANKVVSVDVVTETNGATAYQRLNAVLWSSSSAITSIEILSTASTNFESGSTFTLYGLK